MSNWHDWALQNRERVVDPLEEEYPFEQNGKVEARCLLEEEHKYEYGGRIQTLCVYDIATSLNKALRGHTSIAQSSEAKRWASKVRSACDDIFPVECYPVRLIFTAVFGFNSWSYDPMNVAVTAKHAEDGLKKAGILINDSRQYVGDVVLRSRKDLNQDRTLITIEESVA